MTCLISHGNVQSNLNNQAASQGPVTSESNNLPVMKRSRNPIPVKPKVFADQTVVVRSDSGRMTGTTTATTKVDMDLLARHRDNAMVRYKEKKKTRRYLPTVPFPLTASLFAV